MHDEEHGLVTWKGSEKQTPMQMMELMIRITPIALVLSKDIFMERQPRKRWCVHLGTDYLGLYWQTQQIAGLCNSTLNP